MRSFKGRVEKAGESVTYGREVLRALGVPPAEPTVIMTDNQSNLQVAKDLSAATRSRHFLRRYWALQQRMRSGEARLVKVADPDMPADFLTKWIQSRKLARSVEYATNARARRARAGTLQSVEMYVPVVENI